MAEPGLLKSRRRELLEVLEEWLLLKLRDQDPIPAVEGLKIKIAEVTGAWMLSSISRRELIHKFKALGYSGPFSGGKHQFMIKRFAFPIRTEEERLMWAYSREILRQAGIKEEEWDKA